MRKWRLPVLGSFVFLADLVSKYLTYAYLPVMHAGARWYPYGGIGIFNNFLGIEFSLSHQVNRGAAWGMLADYQLYLLGLRIALVTGLIIYTAFFNKHPSWGVPLTLVIAGAFGNVFDYFLYGHVVDMLHFVLWGYDFPVFNIADASIFMGISSLVVLSFIESKDSHRTSKNG